MAIVRFTNLWISVLKVQQLGTVRKAKEAGIRATFSTKQLLLHLAGTTTLTQEGVTHHRRSVHRVAARSSTRSICSLRS